jgi:hypothetical protein
LSPQRNTGIQHPHGPSHTHGHGHDAHVHSQDEAAAGSTRYDWKVYHPYGGEPGRAAIEVSPRKGLAPRWRFVLPVDYAGVKSWGVGQPGGGHTIAEARRPVHSGPTRITNGPAVVWFGGHDVLSSRLSAYLVFEGDPPHYLAFGEANEPGGPPHKLEGVSFAAHGPHPHGGPGGHGRGEVRKKT